MAIVLLLGACSSGPKFDEKGIDLNLFPRQAVNVFDEIKNARVIWGGQIINAANLKTSTQLEVLSYPLSYRQKPQVEEKPQGRFLVTVPGYLETADFAQGRLVTISGVISAIHTGKVGESTYNYPLLETTQVHLWPENDSSLDSGLHIGIGVIFSN